MKKTYQKPEIVFEDFSLSTSITAGCEFVNGNHGPDACGIVTRGGVVFTEELTGVCTVVPEDGMYNSFCYHNPTDSNNVFAS